jgi:hypothetical protein
MHFPRPDPEQSSRVRVPPSRRSPGISRCRMVPSRPQRSSTKIPACSAPHMRKQPLVLLCWYQSECPTTGLKLLRILEEELLDPRSPDSPRAAVSPCSAGQLSPSLPCRGTSPPATGGSPAGRPRHHVSPRRAAHRHAEAVKGRVGPDRSTPQRSTSPSRSK